MAPITAHVRPKNRLKTMKMMMEIIKKPLYVLRDHKENISNANNNEQIALGLQAQNDLFGSNSGLKFIESIKNPFFRKVFRFAYNSYINYFSRDNEKYLIIS